MFNTFTSGKKGAFEPFLNSNVPTGGGSKGQPQLIPRKVPDISINTPQLLKQMLQEQPKQKPYQFVTVKSVLGPSPWRKSAK